MPAIRLKTCRVEKPWGRTDFLPEFGAAADDGAPLGEIWFQDPSDEDQELLVKYLFTSERLSIQVHPDDGAAQARGYPRGKDEAWVVLAAEPHATIGIGMIEPLTRDELRAAALDGSIEKLLDWRAVKAGDVFYSPAGTVHAIGPGLTLVEIQQNVDLTYRLYDYGRPRELHLEDGVAVSEPVPYVAAHVAQEVSPGRVVHADGPKLVLERWTREGEGTLRSDGRPLWIVPLAGGGTIGPDALVPGGVWLATGETSLTLGAGSDLIVAYPGSGLIADLWR